MALVTIGAIQILGFLMMLPICSMDVPIPWEIRPPTPFSLNDMTAKPTICAQHPATAAPPARPVKDRAAQIAAEETGSVRRTPVTTDTMIPMMNGCCSVAHMIMVPH